MAEDSIEDDELERLETGLPVTLRRQFDDEEINNLIHSYIEYTLDYAEEVDHELRRGMPLTIMILQFPDWTTIKPILDIGALAASRLAAVGGNIQWSLSRMDVADPGPSR